MKNYALIENGSVANIVVWDGDTSLWEPVEGLLPIAIPDGQPVCIGWKYDGAVFIEPPAPAAPPSPPPTAEEVLARRDVLLALAALRIAPLQDAVDLDEATTVEIGALKAWKLYRIALNRIGSAAGFPEAVEWPKEPA